MIGFMLDILDKLKASMFRPINTAAISIMGAFTLLWGFWVGNPFWTVFDQAQVFQFMTIIMPEWAWGILAFSVGLLMLWGVSKNSYRSLRLGSLAGFYYWLFGACNFFVGDWQNTGGITLLMVSIYCGYIALNLYINKASFYQENAVDQENLAFRKDE